MAIVSVEVEALVPVGVVEAGLKVHVLFAGRPEHVKLTTCLNPPTGVTVRVDVTELPGLAGLRATVKSAAAAVW